MVAAPTFIGIDGGGTRATAVLVDADGVELARVEGGPGLVRGGETAAIAAGLVELAGRALELAAAPPAAAICCALAGAGREAVSSAVERAVAAAGVARRAIVVTDAEAAFHDAFGAGPGLLLVAGTGSVGWGRTEDGRSGRVGGWGPVLGDEGSGYALGAAALRAAARAADGRGPPSALAAAVLERCGVEEAESLIGWVGQADKRAIAGLAPAVFAAADTGDAVAAALIADAATELAEHVLVLHRRLGPWDRPPILALAGGLLRPGGSLRGPVLDALGRRDLALPVLDRDVDAGAGAAALARGTAGGAR